MSDECEKCKLLGELYEQTPKTNRDYWVMTELFVMLHDGDVCNKNTRRCVVENKLPMRMTEVVDDISTGAFLKRMSDSACAIVVDYVETKGSGRWIIAMVKKEKLELDVLPSKPKDYVLCELTNTDEWFVLHAGCDYELVE